MKRKQRYTGSSSEKRFSFRAALRRLFWRDKARMSFVPWTPSADAPILFLEQKVCAERKIRIKREYHAATGRPLVVLDGCTKDQYLASKIKKDKIRQSWIATASTGGEVLATIGG